MDILPTTIVQFDMAAHTYKKISLDELSLDLDKNIIYWVHVDLNAAADLEKIAKKLSLPDNILELCEEEKIIPLLIENNDSIAVQVECLQSDQLIDHDIAFTNFIFFLTSQFCFTATSEPTPALKEFESSYPKYVNYAETPCFILFLILDNAINDFSRLLYDFELIADLIDITIREQQDAVYSEVMSRKKQVMKLQHQIAGIRDILMRISGKKIPVISDACRTSLGNLLDHSKIVFNEAVAIRDNLRNTLDQMDNALMQKMNKTMRVLTAFVAIFLPLSLIAGIYGMNFVWIPELHWKFGYFWALGLMIALGLGLYLIFKKMEWF